MLDKITQYAHISKILLKYGFDDELKRSEFASEAQVNERVEPSQRAEEFTRDLVELGPTYVKLGQLLSTRSDLMPASWREALAELQDSVEEIPFDQVREIIENEFGANLNHIFDEFEEKALASASLGQVHLAQIRGSTSQVAVKVQRPGIRDDITRDLEGLAQVAELAEKHTELAKRYEFSRIVNQFRRSILQELDYELEMDNLISLREQLRESRAIVVPKPIEDFCTGRVLTMEYIQGCKITEVSGVVFTEVDGSYLADELFASYLKQVLVDGFFHADPHPGNLLLTNRHQIALLDLGMIGTVPDRLKDQLLQLLAAVAEGRSADVAKTAGKIGVPKEGFDRAKFDEAIIRIIEDRRGSSIQNADVGGLIMDITQAAAVNRLRIPDSLYMLGKMLLNLDAVGLALDKDFDTDASIRRHVAEMSHRRFMAEFKLASFLPDLIELKELFRQAPSRLNSLAESVANNDFRIKVDTIDDEKLMVGFYRIANRITVGLILSSMILGGAILMNFESNFKLFGYPGLAILVFLGAAVGGVILIAAILKGK